jgi:hypothetical protein
MKKFFTSFEFFTLCIVLFFVLVGLIVGCTTPAEKLLTKVNDNCNYQQKNCRTIAEQKMQLLTILGIKSEIVHCKSRSKYSWDHAAVKVSINGEEWFLDNGTIMDIPWKYDEVKKYCYDYELP